MDNLKIAVIGGTGKSGRFVVEQLLHQKFHLKLLVRNPFVNSFENPNVNVLKGDARDMVAIQSLIRDCDVVVSTLGQPQGERPIFSDATHNIIQAMAVTGIKRYIVTTGLSVNTPLDAKSKSVMEATSWMHEHYPETTRDKQFEYELLVRSKLDWTMIRLPRIMETRETFGHASCLEDCIGNSISAWDLGAFIAEEILKGAYIKKCPFVFNL